MERSIQEVAKAAGTTSRTLRHYDAVGLVRPSRVGANGYRYYDDRALVRLQRVLLLRELGLGLDEIGKVLAAQDQGAQNRGAQDRAARGAPPAVEHPGSAEAGILRAHLELLRRERDRVDAQIGAVSRTIAALERGTTSETGRTNGDLMSENIFDGFDHTEYREEVERRWGADAYARGDRWWRGLGEEGQAAWTAKVAELNAAWIAAAEHGDSAESDTAQELARRHVEWLTSIPGTPSSTPDSTPTDVAAYVTGLGEMYVADERFAANYGGRLGAELVRDALTIYADRELRG